MPTHTQTHSTSSTFTTAEVRRQFIDYFVKRHGHTFAPSSPVVPVNDPTLMFTNAGMNQFKDVFLGQGGREYVRAVNTQKCIRAGGKHNDLEDVGRDTYHHTFFEMLGNWSFGDYFKAEAIEWAWDLLTSVWGLDPNRLYVTVFAGDEKEKLAPDLEAEELWKRFVPRERISRWAKKDNFWEMGDTGPCGPCSEIHYDNTPDGTGGRLVNRGDPRVIEIWNLVFIQYNRGPGGKLTPLPAKHVDTGMGLERVTRVLQGKDSNYGIDVFTPIFDAIHKITGARTYQGHLEDSIDIAYRVIADHIRCLTLAITDGARPSNEGRGYVLRRILRRAVRHAHQTLNTRGAWLHKLVPTVVKTLGEAFPELTKNPQHVADVIKDEEESFLSTLDRGIDLFNSYAATAFWIRFHDEQTVHPKENRLGLVVGGSKFFRDAESHLDFHALLGNSLIPAHENSVFSIRPFSNPDKVIRDIRLDELSPSLSQELFKTPPVIQADWAFKLHDTYGFPIDLTRVMAEERGMTVDLVGYEALMEEARAASRKGADKTEKLSLSPDAIAKLKHLNIHPTDDAPKYENKPVTATIRAVWNGSDFDEHVELNRRVAIILDRTNYYAESGGQVGDVGEITVTKSAEGGKSGRFKVEETLAVAGYVLHIGQAVAGDIHAGDRVTSVVEGLHRQPVMANHTMTHVLNLALRETLGAGVDQKGSLVAPDKLRFDFSCSHAMSHEQIERVEKIVNDKIAAALPVFWGLAPLQKAQSINGVRAMFGEKYPDPVRVVCVGKTIEELLDHPSNKDWMNYSIEFCGGTHLMDTAEAKRFVIIQESALAAGVRRIIALTGVAALAAQEAGRKYITELNRLHAFTGEQLVTRFDELTKTSEEMTLSALDRIKVHHAIDELRDRVKQVRKQAKAGTREAVVERARAIADSPQADTGVIIAAFDDADREAVLAALDVLKAKHPDSAILLAGADTAEGKVTIIARSTDALIQKGLKAGDWVKAAAQACGGSGGGKPDMAQAGGKDPEKIHDAVEAARQFARQKVS